MGKLEEEVEKLRKIDRRKRKRDRMQEEKDREFELWSSKLLQH